MGQVGAVDSISIPRPTPMDHGDRVGGVKVVVCSSEPGNFPV